MTDERSFFSYVSKVDDSIQDLVIANEITDGNSKILFNLTVKLRDPDLNDVQRIQIAQQLKVAAEKILSYSTVGDQIFCRMEYLERQNQKEMFNIFYDFRDIKSFKKAALQNTLNSLIAFKSQGIIQNLNPVIDLLQLRLKHMIFLESIQTLIDASYNSAANKSVMKDQNNLSKERFEMLVNEIDTLKKENIKLKDENSRLSADLKKEKTRNDFLSRELDSAREDVFRKQKAYDAKITDFEVQAMEARKSTSLLKEKDQKIKMLLEQVTTLETLLRRQHKL